MIASCIFSPDRAYRYVWSTPLSTLLFRPKPRRLLFLMLNPSTADENEPDPTVTRCLGFGRAWDFDVLTVCNLFAFRSTDPRGLLDVDDPVGPDNDGHLGREATSADRIVLAWGRHDPVGKLIDRRVPFVRSALRGWSRARWGSSAAARAATPVTRSCSRAPPLSRRSPSDGEEDDQVCCRLRPRSHLGPTTPISTASLSTSRAASFGTTSIAITGGVGIVSQVTRTGPSDGLPRELRRALPGVLRRLRRDRTARRDRARLREHRQEDRMEVGAPAPDLPDVQPPTLSHQARPDASPAPRRDHRGARCPDGHHEDSRVSSTRRGRSTSARGSSGTPWPSRLSAA